MSLQYISDSEGVTTGVFIPIEEWNSLKEKFQGIEKETSQIPQWQIEESNRRIELYKKNPSEAIDAEKALNDISKELDLGV